ncbi:MAG: hypothetical protein ACFB12_05810 [Leptolyngbyaceae cyanobacterium]
MALACCRLVAQPRSAGSPPILEVETGLSGDGNDRDHRKLRHLIKVLKPLKMISNPLLAPGWKMQSSCYKFGIDQN